MQSENKKLVSKIRAHGLALSSVFAILVVWYALTVNVSIIDPIFLPSPVKVVTSFFALLRNNLLADVLATVGRVVFAFLLSIIIAIPGALIISEYKTVRKLVTPWVDFIRYIPVPVLIPLTILFFGIGEEAKIILLFIGTFFQLLLLFISEIERLPKEYFELAYTLAFSQRERVTMKLKASLPGMFNNMRVSLGLCWSYVIIAELVAADSGIGHMIKEAQRFSHTAEVFVGIIIMATIGFLSDYIFRKSYLALFPYMKK